MIKVQPCCPTACCQHAGIDVASTTSATEVKVSLGQTLTKWNTNKKKKENLTDAGGRSTGWFRSTWTWKIFTQLSHHKAKQSDHISRCRRNQAKHPSGSRTPHKTDMQTELSPEDTTSRWAELSSQVQGSPMSSLAKQPDKNPARRRMGKTPLRVSLTERNSMMETEQQLWELRRAARWFLRSWLEYPNI